MNIVQIVMLGLVAALLSIILKEQKPELSMMIALVTGLIIFIFAVDKLLPVFDVLKSLSEKAHVDRLYLGIILKIVGIAYITEFTAQILKDADENSIASRVEFGGKVLILLQALPVVTALVDMVLKIMR